MPKTEPKGPSEFRVTWKSAKESLAPVVLKECDFSSGLGPALDKFEKKYLEAAARFDEVVEAARKANTWQAILDVAKKAAKAAAIRKPDPYERFLPENFKIAVPQDKRTGLVKAYEEIQGILTKYQKQIAKANEKFPRLGHAWFALERALYHVDKSIAQDLDSICIQCPPLRIWKYDEYERDGGHNGGEAPKDSDALLFAFCKLARKLEAKPGDPQAAAHALATGAESCLTSYRELSNKLRNVGGQLDGLVTQIVKKIKDGKVGETGASVTQAEQWVTQICGELPEEAFEAKDVLKEQVVGGLKVLVAKATH